MDLNSDQIDEFSSDELSSDEELQLEFAKGTLKPGLIARATLPRTYTNNVAGLREKLSQLKKNELEWLERMDITTTVAAPPLIDKDAPSKRGDNEEEEENKLDPEDDFKREMHFFQQARSSVQIGLHKLEELGVPTQRPEDYFAEMMKTDGHMRKVRQCLLSKQKILEQKEKARKLRDLKKYGKKVQHEILQKRRAEKKSAMDAVKRFRKGKGEKPSFLDRDSDDGFPVATERRELTLKKAAGGSGGPGEKGRFREKSKKRLSKDQNFGFGGKKKWAKSNTSESSANMASFSSARHSRKSGAGIVGGARKKGGRKGKVNRPGKARRQKQKSKLK